MAFSIRQFKKRLQVAGSAQAPASIRFLIRLVNKLMQDDCIGLASELSFSLMLSLVPALIFVFSLFGMIGRQIDLLPLMIDLVNQLAPGEVAPLLKQTIQEVFQGSSGGLTLLSFAGALWSASNGAKVLIKALNRAYNVPHSQQTFWKRNTMGLGVISLLGLTLILASFLILFGSILIHALENFLDLGIEGLTLLRLFRWAIAIISATAFMSLIYTMVPRIGGLQLGWRGVIPSALVFVILWVGISLLFDFYITSLNRLNPVYGTLGAVIVLMTWLYLSALAMLTGGEIAALLTLSKPEESNRS